jgi:uncharacterized glyoxalase superfamily protein PhnB
MNLNTDLSFDGRCREAFEFYAKERVFSALAQDGTVQMAFQETVWAKGFGMLVDQFGIPWIVNAGEAVAG